MVAEVPPSPSQIAPLSAGRVVAKAEDSVEFLEDEVCPQGRFGVWWWSSRVGWRRRRWLRGSEGCSSLARWIRAGCPRGLDELAAIQAHRVGGLADLPVRCTAPMEVFEEDAQGVVPGLAGSGDGEPPKPLDPPDHVGDLVFPSQPPLAEPGTEPFVLSSAATAVFGHASSHEP